MSGKILGQLDDITKKRPFVLGGGSKSLETGAVKSIPTPNRSERISQFGIECVDQIHFLHWEPGGEYVKNIVVKNVIFKTQKINYKLPKTKFFSMDFPEVTTLSTGMSYTIPITFRPVAKEPYFDVIEFSCSMGKFYFPILATLAKHAVEFEPSIDFMFCPVNETAEKTISFRNCGELTTHFNWFISEPFRITPSQGTLKPNEEIKVSVEFHPVNASSFEAKAICGFGDNIHELDKDQTTADMNHKILSIKGVGKYSYLTVLSTDKNLKKENDDVKIDFGRVFVGRSANVNFELKNLSQVLAKYTIKREPDESGTQTNFQFSVSNGELPGLGHKQNIQVTFTPSTPESFSMQYFQISTISGNTLRFALCGMAIGPDIQLNTKLLNFGDVESGSHCSRAFTITNTSKAEAFYEFHMGDSGVFEMDKFSGHLSPESFVGITVKFHPVEPSHYYRRVYCLIEHQDPLVIELVGTCYDDKRRPPSFDIQQIKKYRHRLDMGLYPYPPEQLDEMIRLGTILVDEEGFLQPANPKSFLQNVPSSKPDSYSEQYFCEQTIAFSPEVQLETQNLDFGSCSKFRVIDPMTLRVSNRSRGKMICQWVNPTSSVFTIQPLSADIQPKSSFDFKVFFQPTMDDHFYGVNLEAYVYYKSMRSFRLVSNETFTPPWYISAHVAGNTFTKADSFIPKITFNNDILEFPACMVGQQVFRTVKVTNTGDTPVKYWLNLEGSRVFSAKPQNGLLAQNQSQLIMFRFAPNDERHYDFPMECHFNTGFSSHHMQILGNGYFPKISLDPGLLCIKPTAVRGITRRSFTIKNLTKIYVAYRWNIPYQYNSVVSINPTEGILKPNAMQEVQFFFAPQYVRPYVFKLSCYYSQASPDTDVVDLDLMGNKATLTVMGQGIEGVIQSEESVIDFGSILVNHPHTQRVTLFNPSDCDLMYKLTVSVPEFGSADSSSSNNSSVRKKQTIEEFLESPRNMQSSSPVKRKTDLCQADLEGLFTFEPDRNIIPARSKISVKIKTSLSEQKQYVARLNYVLIQQDLKNFQDGNNLASGSNLRLNDSLEMEERKLALIQANGVFPLLKVSDVRTIGLPKGILWDMLNIDRFNELLCFDARKDYVDHKSAPAIDFDLFAAVAKSDPIVIEFEFQNQGVVDIDWGFIFPNDLEIHQEAHAAHLAEEHAKNKALEHKLFQVSPRNGLLAPLDKMTVTISYNPILVGEHTLPLILKIANGPPSWLGSRIITLKATTFSSKEAFVPCTLKKWTLAPVPISSMDPPIQTYRFYNKGRDPVAYEVDMRVLKMLQDDNDGYEVLRCLAPQGIVQPNSTLAVDWIFSPTKYGPFNLDVPITINDRNVVNVQFQGMGLDEKADIAIADIDKIPLSTSMRVEGGIASLSQDRFNFGCLPVASSKSAIVTIKNECDDDIEFSWKIADDATAQVTMQPMRGKIDAGKCFICKIIFQSQLDSRLVNFDVWCQFNTSTEMSDYNLSIQVLDKLIQEKKTAELNDKRRLSNEDVNDNPDGNNIETGKNGPPYLGKYKTPLPRIQSKKGGTKNLTSSMSTGPKGNNATTSTSDDEDEEIPEVEEEVYTSHPILNVRKAVDSVVGVAGVNASRNSPFSQGRGKKDKEIPSYMKNKEGRKTKDQVIVKGYVLTANSDYPKPPDPFVLPISIKARVMSSQEYGQSFPHLRDTFFRPGIVWGQAVSLMSSKFSSDTPILSRTLSSLSMSGANGAGNSATLAGVRTRKHANGAGSNTLNSLSNSILFDLLDQVMDDLEDENLIEQMLDQAPYFIKAPVKADAEVYGGPKALDSLNDNKTLFQNDVRFQEIARDLLDNTILNLLSEACHGHYDITNLKSLKLLAKHGN